MTERKFFTGREAAGKKISQNPRFFGGVWFQMELPCIKWAISLGKNANSYMMRLPLFSNALLCGAVFSCTLQLRFFA